jgi:hypothetical protein
MPSGRSLGWPGTRPRRQGRGYIRESGSILHVVGMGVKRIGTDHSTVDKVNLGVIIRTANKRLRIDLCVVVACEAVFQRRIWPP